MPRHQPSWCQDIKISLRGGAEPPAKQLSWCQEIKIPSRARHFVYFPRIRPAAGNPQKQPFWYQNTKMSICHDTSLFTTLEPCFPGAKATKISIFWYPESRIKPPWAPLEQPSGTQAGRYSRHGSQAAHQRSPKVSKSFAREAHCYHWLVSPPLTGYPKIDHFCTILPECRYIRKTYYLLHFSNGFGMPGPPKYTYFGTPNRA